MRTTRAIRTGLLVVAASLPLTLVACGDDDEDVTSGGSTTVNQPGTSDPGTSDPGTSDPSAPPASTVDWEWYGLSKDAAQAKADDEGVPLRILREDDMSFDRTDDLWDGRVNVNIDAGFVTWVEVERNDGMHYHEGSSEPEDQEYLGLSEAEAGARADEAGRAWRVTVRDGEGLAVTMDFSADRLNFEVADDTVMAVSRG